MEFLTDPVFWHRWLIIVLIALALAGDNAVVIALAVRGLPPMEQFYGRIYGTVGAVALELILKDKWFHSLLGSHGTVAHHTAPAIFGCVIAALGWWWSRKGNAVGENA